MINLTWDTVIACLNFHNSMIKNYKKNPLNETIYMLNIYFYWIFFSVLVRAAVFGPLLIQDSINQYKYFQISRFDFKTTI